MGAFLVSSTLAWSLSRKGSIFKPLTAGLKVVTSGKLRIAGRLVVALALLDFGLSQPVRATELGPFFWVEPPTVQIQESPKPLYAPYGYYGLQGGCVRKAVWQGKHWRSVTVCHR